MKHSQDHVVLLRWEPEAEPTSGLGSHEGLLSYRVSANVTMTPASTLIVRLFPHQEQLSQAARGPLYYNMTKYFVLCNNKKLFLIKMEQTMRV